MYPLRLCYANKYSQYSRSLYIVKPIAPCYTVDMLRTKEQRKKLCTGCPMARAADIIGDTCSLLIIRDLLGGSRRFGDLTESLEGVSTRTLASKLKYLEKSGFLTRTAFTEKPPRVEYSLTKKGRALRGIISSMRAYGEKFL